jgi:hypothetical protein
MPPAVAAAAITGAGVLGAGALGFAGAKSAAKSQQQASDQAITLAREQEAERKREWEAQQKAAAYQWQVMQANLAPYRAARASVLSKYGINTNVDAPPMPADFGMPGSAAPVTPMPQRGGGGPNPMLMGAGILAGSMGPAFAAYQRAKEQNPYTQVPGPYTSNEVGAPGGPPGPPASPVDLSNLYNWADWQQAIGGSAGG